MIGSTTLQNQLSKRLPLEFITLIGGSADTAYASAPIIKNLPQPLQQEVVVAFSDSIGVIWYVAIGMAVFGLAISSLMKEIPMHAVTDEDWGIDRTDEAATKDDEKV